MKNIVKFLIFLLGLTVSMTFFAPQQPVINIQANEDVVELMPFFIPGPLGIRTLRATSFISAGGIILATIPARTTLSFINNRLGTHYEVFWGNEQGFVNARDIGWVDCW